MIRKIILPTIFLCVLSCFAEKQTKAKEFFSRFKTLPEYYFEQDARYYSNHKNQDYSDAYLISALSDFTGYLVSFDSIVYFGGFYVNYLGMGRQNEAILFDPRDVHYALTPFFEFRHKEIFYQMGLDHRCFHEVDRDTRDVPYWNQLYIKISSENYRFQIMNKKYMNGEERGDFLDKLKWSVGFGYFIRKFGKKDESLISGGHPWVTTAYGDVGYSFYRTNNWIFSGRKKFTYWGDADGKAYWAGEIGLDADVYKRKHSVGFFINYNYEFPRPVLLYSTSPNYPKDPILVFSKDKLIELGIRWRY